MQPLKELQLLSQIRVSSSGCRQLDILAAQSNAKWLHVCVHGDMPCRATLHRLSGGGSPRTRRYDCHRGTAIDSVRAVG